MTRGYLLLFCGFLLSLDCSAQHPNYKRVDSIKKVLSFASGTQRVDCLNALCEEYWWPACSKTFSDSVSNWAKPAYEEAIELNYTAGIAESIMIFGVEEIHKDNFLSAEKYLRKGLNIFEAINNEFGIGWCNMWLAQTLYSQNYFQEALRHLKTSLFFLNKLNDLDGKAKAWAWMGGIYANLGNYDSSYFYCSESLRIRQQMSDHSCVAYSFANMGHLYKIAGSNEDALYYYRLAFNYANTHAVDYYVTSLIYLEPIGNIYKALNWVDSSYYYLQRAIEVDPDNKMKQISFGETLLKKGEIDSALLIFSKPIKHFREQNDKWDLMRVLLNVAKVYQAKKADSEALQYALESLSIAKQADAKQNILEAYKLLLALYNNLDKRDSAYFFLEKYTALKDSLVNTQFLWKLSNYKKQEDFKRQLEELAFLDKENKIKEEKLHQEAKLKWILLAGLLITALSGFMIYKNLVLKRKHDKLESRHRQTELQHHITELEMQALRAQMSPHFIFNCLNSINRFILKNEMEAASNYLTKFSRLIRMVLTHSKKTFISLEDELEMLRLYLDMERLRFKDAFEYSIIFKNSVDVGNVFVPPLLLQPFAENAIWHGLMHKDGNGHLEIELSIDKKVLNFTITDDGVGRSKAAEIKSSSVEKQKSMGLKITADRLALLNKDNEQPTSFNVEDIIDNEGKPAGTRVILKMNYKNLIEVTT